MKEITVDAVLENLDTVQDFISGTLEEFDCPMKLVIQMNIAIEEIYVNVCSYAYAPNIGEVTVFCGVNQAENSIIVQFKDKGMQFDPVAKQDADITLSAEERGVGGLGILMVKKSMDVFEYEYEDGKNVLTLKKHL